jgi:hypothetical protein
VTARARVFPLGHNYDNKEQLRPPDKMDFRPARNSTLIDAGREMPGITDGSKGKAPDIVADEDGRDFWIPWAN